MSIPWKHGRLPTSNFHPRTQEAATWKTPQRWATRLDFSPARWAFSAQRIADCSSTEMCFFPPPVLFNLKLSKVGNPFRTSILKQLCVCVCAMLRCFYNDKFTPLKTSLIRNQHVLVSKSWVIYMMFGQMFIAWVELYWVGFFGGNATESSCVATVVFKPMEQKNHSMRLQVKMGQNKCKL